MARKGKNMRRLKPTLSSKGKGTLNLDYGPTCKNINTLRKLQKITQEEKEANIKSH